MLPPPCPCRAAVPGGPFGVLGRPEVVEQQLRGFYRHHSFRFRPLFRLLTMRQGGARLVEEPRSARAFLPLAPSRACDLRFPPFVVSYNTQDFELFAAHSSTSGIDRGWRQEADAAKIPVAICL